SVDRDPTVVGGSALHVLEAVLLGRHPVARHKRDRHHLSIDRPAVDRARGNLLPRTARRLRPGLGADPGKAELAERSLRCDVGRPADVAARSTAGELDRTEGSTIDVGYQRQADGSSDALVHISIAYWWLGGSGGWCARYGAARQLAMDTVY